RSWSATLNTNGYRGASKTRRRVGKMVPDTLFREIGAWHQFSRNWCLTPFFRLSCHNRGLTPSRQRRSQPSQLQQRQADECLGTVNTEGHSVQQAQLRVSALHQRISELMCQSRLDPRSEEADRFRQLHERFEPRATGPRQPFI